MATFYSDGQFIDENEAMISVKDLSVLRGYGVFDFLRSYNRKPFYLMAHIQRFRNSANLIGLEIKETDEELEQIVLETIAKNPQFKEVNIRFIYSGGVSPDGVTPAGNGKLIIMVTPKHELPSCWYTEGIKAITVDQERFIPGAKSINYIGAIIAQKIASQEGAIEALYHNSNGTVTEGTTTNLFGFKNGIWTTPEKNILPGITRQVLLELLGEQVAKADITKDELLQFDEVFICASNKEIVPIVKINETIIGNGKVGPETKKVINLFKEFTDEFAQN